MRMFDISCDATQEDDGTFTLLIKATGLDFAQAKAIGNRMQVPFRDICTDVLSDGGRLKTVHQNLLETKQ